MTTTASPKHRLRTTLIIAASILVIAGIAGGTVLLLKHFTPVKITNAPNNTAQTDDAPIKKAEELFAKGDYTGAKAQYQSILDTYKNQKNEAGVKDIEVQLQIVEAATKAPQEPQNTDRNRVIMGPKPE